MTVVRNEFERGENNPVGVLLRARAEHRLSLAQLRQVARSAAAATSRTCRSSALQAFYRTLLPARQRRARRRRPLRRAADARPGRRDFGAIPQPQRALPDDYTDRADAGRRARGHVRRVGDVQIVMAALSRAAPARTRTSCRCRSRADAARRRALGPPLQGARRDGPRVAGRRARRSSCATPACSIFFAMVREGRVARRRARRDDRDARWPASEPDHERRSRARAQPGAVGLRAADEQLAGGRASSSASGRRSATGG